MSVQESASTRNARINRYREAVAASNSRPGALQDHRRAVANSVREAARQRLAAQENQREAEEASSFKSTAIVKGVNPYRNAARAAGFKVKKARKNKLGLDKKHYTWRDFYTPPGRWSKAKRKQNGFA